MFILPSFHTRESTYFSSTSSSITARHAPQVAMALFDVFSQV